MEIIEQDPQREIDELRRRLGEAEETLSAIRSGMVDALVVTGLEGEKVFILKGADHPYRVMIEEMNEGAVTLASDGTILYCNRRFAALLKTPLEWVIGSSIQKYFVPKKEFESLIQAYVQGKAELQIRCSDGSDIPVLVSYNPVLIEDLKSACLIITDLTELKRQAALVEEARRLAVMGGMAAVLAHEIANPLNGIFTVIQVMQRYLSAREGSAPDVFLTTNLGDLRLEIERLAGLLESFRTLARVPLLQLGPVDIRLLLSEVEKMIGGAPEYPAIEITHAFPVEMPVLTADAERLKQIFLNLFKNAIEAMPSGGKLTVGVAPHDKDVVINISDTGSGIPKGVDIFQPFTTTKPQGTGLGLAVVRELLAAHGGTISYTSKQGEGTTFQVVLPLEFQPCKGSATP